MAWGRRYTTARGEIVRSRFEKTVLDDLDARGVAYDYEPHDVIWYDSSLRHLVCQDCQSDRVKKTRWYLPDAEVWASVDPPRGFVLEIKGRLTSDDRKTLEGVKAAHPAIDLRVLFMRDNPIRPKSKTRYSDWARKAGFPYHVGAKVPDDWLR